MASKSKKASAPSLPPYLQIILPPAGAAVAYGLSLQASQMAGRACRVSCATVGWSSLLGCLAVTCSSLAAGQVSFTIRKYLASGPGKPEDFIISKEDAILTVVTGLLGFKVLGGKFHNLMPSDLCKPGALANFSIPAAGPNQASASQYKQLNEAFCRDGCHHCGRRSGDSIADHIPPSVIIRSLQKPHRGFLSSFFSVKKNTAQRFYPQCLKCMKKQSAFLINGKNRLVYHLKRGFPQPPYLAGFLVGAHYFESSHPEQQYWSNSKQPPKA